MNKWLTALSVILLAMVLAACGSSDNTENGNADGDQKTLKVATESNFMPFSYQSKGEVVGFDMDILEAVMAEAGYEYEVENLSWEAMLISVEQQDSDLAMAGITINEKRQEMYDLSSPYFESTHKVVFPEGEGITSGEDIKDLKVGVQAGTTGEEAAEKILGKNANNLSKYDSNTLALMALQSGDIEAVVTDNVVADEYIANNPDAAVEMIEDPETFESEFYGILLPKDSELTDEVNEALATVIEDGRYAEIYEEWFGVEPNIEAITQ
ncbi:basic amino acid ABC transporter substrate-binding protein [Gracilibacillus alcaliphilus]|uniref:basic amino acid ABC transporter substrate-binding protein n=1 Tax=Gracilibacillus alcaliphilus TaxID=1401441 RepID=UPI00195D2855|nr:basic amino acid ABC transporter substrate-binding protein [Gracilibacillus alcaliphilus]MBM7677087.1 polar amino acid transport system substrate-binding protein [Gracilibacillus alcaliphilus]